jgi:hypothetical protein
MNSTAFANKSVSQRAALPRKSLAVHLPKPVRVASKETETEVDQYLGFEKYDFDRSNGRKGRVIKDDSKKYPAKDNLGPFLGVTGGWAGGEAAISRIRDEAAAAMPAAARALSPAPALPSPEAGQKLIYFGYTKDQIEYRNAGNKGRVGMDDPAKYPDKDNIGPLLGATGGFAAGEAGLRMFVDQGELKLRQPGDSSKGQGFPFAVLFVGATYAAVVYVFIKLLT